MTTDDLRTRAREAAVRYSPAHVSEYMGYWKGYMDGFLAHEAQQPSREQIARAMHADDLAHGREVWRWEDMSAKWHDRYRSNADVVLALLDGADR